MMKITYRKADLQALDADAPTAFFCPVNCTISVYLCESLQVSLLSAYSADNARLVLATLAEASRFQTLESAFQFGDCVRDR